MNIEKTVADLCKQMKPDYAETQTDLFGEQFEVDARELVEQLKEK